MKFFKNIQRHYTFKGLQCINVFQFNFDLFLHIVSDTIYLPLSSKLLFTVVVVFVSMCFCLWRPDSYRNQFISNPSEQHWRTLESQRRALAFLWLCDQRMSLVHASPCVPLPHHHELWAGLWRRGLGSDPHTTTAHAWKGKKHTVSMNKWMNACCSSTWGAFLSNLMNSENW